MMTVTTLDCSRGRLLACPFLRVSLQLSALQCRKCRLAHHECCNTARGMQLIICQPEHRNDLCDGTCTLYLATQFCDVPDGLSHFVLNYESVIQSWAPLSSK